MSKKLFFFGLFLLISFLVHVRGGQVSDVRERDFLAFTTDHIPPSDLLSHSIELDGLAPDYTQPLSSLFAGLSYNDVQNYYPNNPPDPILAVGLDHVVLLVNSAMAVYDKNSPYTQVLFSSLKDWFQELNPPDPDRIFDPRIVFDHYENRFVLVALSKKNTNNTSVYLIAVSESYNPTGNWYKYKLDATTNYRYQNHYPSNLCADFPGLGYDDKAVYITSNQLEFNGGPFHYSRIRILRKSELYSGNPDLHIYDFWENDLKNADGSYAFTVQPATHYTQPADAYFVNNKNHGSIEEGLLTLWKLDDPLNPSSLQRYNIFIESYAEKSDSEAPQESGLLDISDARVQKVVYRNGLIYLTFTEGYDFGSGEVSALRYVKINAANNQVMLNVTYGHADRHYFFPSIFVDGEDNISLVFNSNYNHDLNPAKKYPGVFYTTRMNNENQTRNSRILQGGISTIKLGNEAKKRYGDYTGICLDPLNDNQFWFCGEYVISNYNWGTYIGSIITDHSTVPVTLRNVIAEENAGGKLMLKRSDGNHSLIPSGYTLMVKQNTSYQSHTQNERLPINIYSHKHHDWNDNYGEYKMEHSLSTGTSSINDNAIFISLKTGNVPTFLISASQYNLIDIDFKDPWYIEEDGSQPDTFKTYNTPFTPGSG